MSIPYSQNEDSTYNIISTDKSSVWRVVESSIYFFHVVKYSFENQP